MKALSKDEAFSFSLKSSKMHFDLMFFVYIIYSEKLRKYYVGSTNDVADRLHRHNAGESSFTSRGSPWTFVAKFECVTRPEAVQLEMKIKKRGITRHLQDISFNKTQ
jgi:putative endonuclease